ncbi:MAG TPA: VWA domain-containing protein [Thermoanaerobaculia bacterium]|jgi:Ca-activated chloride channel family protein|nr:VWA domain-containing protein [Thermoanaerobaculia bacterium]
MKRALAALLFLPLPLFAAEGKIIIAIEPLGDSAQGEVVTRVTYRFTIPTDAPSGVPLVITGSITQHGEVVKRFRYPLLPETASPLTSVQTLQPGEAEIDAKLMVPLEEQTPVILAKATQTFTIVKTDKLYVAHEGDDAGAILAEGIVPEGGGSVKIIPPRRDIAPNLFIVEVDAQPPVKRVEFWVDDKKIMARNAPPYRAELDLGALPKRVEVRAVGYDAAGRYVDADAFVVNEHETPLEVKITRTVTADDVSHFKLSVQNPKATQIKSAVFFAGQKKLYEWSAPPYALDIPNSRLRGVEFVRASLTDETNYEASDLLFLNGQRFSEEIEVNLVELPVMVTDNAGVPVTDLKEANFSIFENGQPEKVASFNYASNLPISAGVLIDHSGSMKPRMEQAKSAALEFFKRIMKPGDRAFVTGFAFDAKSNSPFVTDVGSLESQVRAIPDASGGTALYDAIVTGLYRFRTLQGRKALIILTDGEDTTSSTSYEQMLTYARSARVPLYFIGVGLGLFDASGTSKMKALAAETGGIAYFIHDIKQIDETYARLDKDLRSQYLIAYNTQSTTKDRAYRKVEVKVDRAGAMVRTIRGFIP